MTKRRFLRGVYPELAEGLRMTVVESISAAGSDNIMTAKRNDGEAD